MEFLTNTEGTIEKKIRAITVFRASIFSESQNLFLFRSPKTIKNMFAESFCFSIWRLNSLLLTEN